MHTYIVSTQLHGFSDASECAYACVVYLHMLGSVYSSLVISKMKVTLIKRLTVPPWLELCGTCLIAELLYIVRDASNCPLTKSSLGLTAPLCSAYWEVIHDGSKLNQQTVCPKFFEILPPDCWRHVDSSQNRWTVHPQVVPIWTSLPYSMVGRTWLAEVRWISMVLPASCSCSSCATRRENCVSIHVQTESKPPAIPFTQYSNFSHLIHVTTWILWFIHNRQAKKHQIPKQLSFLTIQ